jgi:hypothetical protein
MLLISLSKVVPHHHIISFMDANPGPNTTTFDELMLKAERNCNPVAACHRRISPDLTRVTPNSYLFQVEQMMYFPIMN